MFSCEFYEISKNNFFYRTSPVGASEELSLILPFAKAFDSSHNKNTKI